MKIQIVPSDPKPATRGELVDSTGNNYDVYLGVYDPSDPVRTHGMLSIGPRGGLYFSSSLIGGPVLRPVRDGEIIITHDLEGEDWQKGTWKNGKGVFRKYVVTR